MPRSPAQAAYHFKGSYWTTGYLEALSDKGLPLAKRNHPRCFLRSAGYTRIWPTERRFEVSTTIRQVQDDITNPEIKLSDILRKAKVLSYRLNVPEFKQWVNQELDGYPGQDTELPDYRHFPAHNYGTFSGFGGSIIHNQPIPTYGLQIPDFARKHIEKIELRQGVAALEEATLGAEEGTIMLPWPADLVALASQPGQIIRGHALSSAWQLLSKNQMAGILDTVRNRLLAFMLELEEQFPDLAESEEAAKSIPTEQAAQIFHTHVYGGQNVIASGQDFTQQVVFPSPDLAPGDLEALLDYMRKLNVPEEDVAELQEALEEDEASSELGELGPQTSGWLAKLTMKGFEGASSGTAGQAVQHVGKAIAKYYGIDLGPS